MPEGVESEEEEEEEEVECVCSRALSRSES